MVGKRFTEIECINASDEVRKGVLSLVFKARDTVEDVFVVLKFMDPERLGDRYRLGAFEREPEIIEKLGSNFRCLSLIAGPIDYNWKINLGEVPSHLPLKYFATNWLEEDIEHIFQRQGEIGALDKLQLFRNVILAVEAIHAAGIHHRDLKPDNFRATVIKGEKMVAAIDFGTAAHLDTPHIPDHHYQNPVGAPAYASPEMYIGFSGDREVGQSTDVYALGSMLYQLFNPDLFLAKVVANPLFQQALLILNARTAHAGSYSERLAIWKNEVSRFRHAVRPPSILAEGNSVPSAISTNLERLHASMTSFDFTLRLSNLEKARCVIDSCIRCLENAGSEKRRLELKRARRAQREEKLRRRQEKLDEYLNSGSARC